MFLSLKMRLALFLSLAVTICCVYADRDYEVLVRALANGGSHKQRQFISTIKRWFSRSGEMEKMKVPTKTKIKYLPVYVPYPIQPHVQLPSEMEYYGAYQDHKKHMDVEHMYQGASAMPNGGRIPPYMSAHHPGLSMGDGNFGTYGTGSVDLENNDSIEFDSEVLDNPELVNEFSKNKSKGSRVRKVRRKNKIRSSSVGGDKNDTISISSSTTSTEGASHSP